MQLRRRTARRLSHREMADRLQLAIFVDLEVVSFEIGDQVVSLVCHRDAHVDQIHAAAKHGRLLPPLGGEPRLRGRSRAQGRRHNHRQEPTAAHGPALYTARRVLQNGRAVQPGV